MGKKIFVLIHDAWHGGWVWKDVAARLRAREQVVTTPTLTGLGDRRHCATYTTSLSTHIEDVAEHMFMEDLGDVTLVGWGYGALVAAGVASRLPSRVRSLIYVDSLVPEHGRAVVDYVSPDTRVAMERVATEHHTLYPVSFEELGVHEPHVISFVEPRLIGQPWLTFFEPLMLPASIDHIPASYVHCSRSGIASIRRAYEDLRAADTMSSMVIDTGHLCMVSEPELTTELLLQMAELPSPQPSPASGRGGAASAV